MSITRVGSVQSIRAVGAAGYIFHRRVPVSDGVRVGEPCASDRLAAEDPVRDGVGVGEPEELEELEPDVPDLPDEVDTDDSESLLLVMTDDDAIVRTNVRCTNGGTLITHVRLSCRPR